MDLWVSSAHSLAFQKYFAVLGELKFYIGYTFSRLFIGSQYDTRNHSSRGSGKN